MNVENKQMKIAYLTSLDPQDRRSWSGTVYYASKALQKHCGEVSYIGPIKTKEQLLGKVIHKSAKLFLRKKFAYNLSFFVAKSLARVAARRLARQSFDVIVTVADTGSTAYLDTDIPIVLVEDATFALLHNYHQNFSNLLDWSAREANAVMDLSLNKASLLIYSSEWAARSAIEENHVDPQKVHVIPFGANFEHSPPQDVILEREKSDRCRLLFIGANWERKGGDVAFETLLKLEEMGIQAELTICGCLPPRTISHERVRVIPFLDKNDEGQRKELEQLYMTSDFLLLPTKNDCSPIVICEASVFGLPVIAAHTGGIPGLVRDGENGFVLPYSARGTEYAEVVARVYRDNQQYNRLVRSSRAMFEERLNWDTWGSAMKKLLTEMLAYEHSGLAKVSS